MNLLIVEDEISIRMRIATTVPWEEHDIHVVGLAENGLQALEMMKKRSPDVVLLDIQMSEMNGIEFAREVVKSYPSTKMIVLSGYDYFEYARSAMEAGVQKYLLKPADNEEILQAVCEAARQLQQEREQMHSIEWLRVRWKDHLPLVRNVLLNNWLELGYSEWELKRDLHNIALHIPLDRYFCVVVFDMDPLPENGDGRFTERDEALLSFALHSITDELLTSEDCHVFQDEKGRTVVLVHNELQEDQNEDRLLAGNMAIRVLNMVKDCLKLTVSAGISQVGYGWSSVPELYRQAKSALLQRLLYGQDVACHYTEQDGEVELSDTDIADERLLEASIDIGEREKVAIVMSRLVQSALKESSSVNTVHMELIYLTNLVVRIIRERNWPLSDIVGEDLRYLSNVQLLQSRQSIEQLFQRLAVHMAEYGAQRSEHGGNRLIHKVLETIDQQLDQNLSLHGLAERFYINSSYLSRLFKHNTGQTFSEYVLDRKMKKARQFLLSGALVQDAAQQVGYTNVGFFSKQFLKHWGVLPRDLKN